jgi:predicted metal-dependent hydrolase
MAISSRGPKQIVDLGNFEITLKRQVICYSLRRSHRARLIWLNIKRQTGLSVTIPQDYDVNRLPEYLDLNSNWILRNLDRFYHEMPTPTQLSAASTGTISYLGKSLKVTQKTKIRGPTAVRLDDNESTVRVMLAKGKLAMSELLRWLKEQAMQLIKSKTEQYSKMMGLIYNKVTIRDQKSRWGSCSYRKNLNFNWRLIMAPEPVLDYVVIHELCHLKVMAHSRSFWSLVSKYCPHWREYRTWLDDHCLQLNSSFEA